MFLLGGSPNPVEDPTPFIVIDGPDPAIQQVNLTAHFIPGEPEVNEEIDAIVDALLDDLMAQCGMGAEDFSEGDLESGNRTGAMDGGRILPHSGQELRDEVDLSLPGLDHPTQINFTRRHMTRRNAERSPFGPAWFFNYRIYFTRDDDGNILLHNLGRTDVFAVDPERAEVWNGTGGRFGRMVRETANRVVLRAPGGVKWQFLSIWESWESEFRGILEKIISPNGNEIRFEYETAAKPLLDLKMTRVIDAFGRPIELIYGPDGEASFVTEVRDQTDPGAVRVWQYNYDGQGRLTSVRSPTVTSTSGFNDFPQGKRTNYTYHMHSDARLTNALTSIGAPNQVGAGQSYLRYQWTYYDQDPADPLFGYVKSHTMGLPVGPYPLRSGGTFQYSYQPMVSQGGINEVSMCTTVTDRAGVTTALDYNKRGLLLEERIENPDAELSKTAPSHFKRGFSYNPRGDMVRSKTPIQSDPSETSSYREEHPDPASTPLHMLRQERRKVLAADQRGGDQTEIVVETRYEPIFNKQFSTVDPRGLGANAAFPAEEVTTYRYYDYMEDLTGAIDHFAPELGLTVSELTHQFNLAGIPQRLQERWGVNPLGGHKIDINGDGRTELDPCGNLLRRDFPDVNLPEAAVQLGLNLTQQAFETFTYNRYGQLIQYVDPEKNVTTHFYFPASDPNGWDGQPPGASYQSGGGFPARTIESDAVLGSDANSGSGAPPVRVTTEYAYDEAGTYPRNARGVATTVTDGRGVVSRNLINELDQLVIHQSAWQVPPGNPDLEAHAYQRRNFYDANGNIRETSVLNKDGLSGGPTFYYDSTIFNILDQPVRKQRDSKNNGLNITTELEYDANQNLVRQTEAVGTPEEAVTQWQYDARDLLVSITLGASGDPALGEVASFTYEYDQNGNRVRAYDADGDITQYEYDGLDRLFRTVDRVGNVQQTQFDAASHTISSETYGPAEEGGASILLRKTEMLFDQRGRAFETLQHLFHYPNQNHGVIDPGGNGTLTSSDYGLVRQETIFDRSGRPIGKVDPDGDLFVTQYNGMSGVYQTLDPLGNTVLNQYDGNHNLIVGSETEIDPNGQVADEVFVTQLGYDALNRNVSVTEPNGQVSRIWFDSRNNVVRTADHLNNSVEFHYDALNRKTDEIRYLAAGGIGAGSDNFNGTIHLKTEWDALHRMTAQIDHEDNRTAYHYDDLGRRIAIEQPGGQTETWVYNGDGELLNNTNAAGSVATWQYDAAGRALQVTVDHSGMDGDFLFEGTALQRWAYDGLNRRIYAYDDNGFTVNPAEGSEMETHYHYDSLSRPILELQALGEQETGQPLSMGKRVVQEWQGATRLVSLTYPNGRRINRTYDALDRLADIRESGGNLIAAYQYMGPQRDLQIRYGNGTVMSKVDPVSPTTLGFGYDQNRRSLNHNWTREGDGTLITGYTNTYNGASGLGSNRLKAQYRQHLQRGDEWNFDSRYRMTGFLRNEDRFLASSRVFDGTDAMVEFQDEGFHQNPIPDWKWLDYAYFGSLPRSHDDNGNLRSDTQVEYSFDFFNRLVAVRQGNNGPMIAEYLYDAGNRRVLKTVGGDTVRYLYSGWQVIEERNGSEQTLRQFVDGRGLDEHVQLLDVNDSGLAYYYHCNPQGFVGALSDETGQVVEYAEYSMLGRPTLLEGGSLVELPNAISSVGNPYLFQGRRYDAETKFYYFRNRYFDPLTGNFITLDPLGRWQHGQGNGFSAFSADPWNNHDPMGLDDIFNDTLNLLMAGLQGADETMERFYNWIGLGLEDETVNPPTLGYTHIQEAELEGAQARNENRRKIRTLIEAGSLMFGQGSGCTGRFFGKLSKMFQAVSRRPLASTADDYGRVLISSSNDRYLNLGNQRDVVPWQGLPGHDVINIGRRSGGVDERVFGPISQELNEELLIDHIVNGNGVILRSQPGVDNMLFFDRIDPISGYQRELDLLRLLGYLGGSP